MDGGRKAGGRAGGEEANPQSSVQASFSFAGNFFSGMPPAAQEQVSAASSQSLPHI